MTWPPPPLHIHSTRQHFLAVRNMQIHIRSLPDVSSLVVCAPGGPRRRASHISSMAKFSPPNSQFVSWNCGESWSGVFFSATATATVVVTIVVTRQRRGGRLRPCRAGFFSFFVLRFFAYFYFYFLHEIRRGGEERSQSQSQSRIFF